MTAGTRYGAQPKGELVPITHNPGVNCAHRMENLREVNFFEVGCIGAEDVVLDAKIQRAGHKIFIDPSNVMPHRRRKPFKPYMKQMRNYGYRVWWLTNAGLKLRRGPTQRLDFFLGSRLQDC